MRRLLFVPAVLLLVATGGSSSSGDSEAAPSSTAGQVAEASTTTPSLVASTLESLATTSESAEPAETTETTAGTTATTPTTAASTTEGVGALLEPGDAGEFASPSGNIACLLSTDYGANCWISEKQWTIPQPDGPDCDISDYGNAIVVGSSGVDYPCYTDFIWNPDAAPLAYGDRMKVGQFVCESATNGVTCQNGDGQGFRVARSEVVIF